jgi:Mrp family chromosome partitioning ATPase
VLQGETRPEPSPRERLERLRVLGKRTRGYWKGALVVAVLVAAAGTLVAWRLPRIYMSETLLLVRDAIRTGPEEDGQGLRASRIAPKLKDLLTARSRLEGIISELKLYPSIVERRGVLDAVEEMRLHIGFRGRDSDTFLISFQSEDPAIAQKVTARLADSMIEDFVADSLDRAVTTRDFLAKEEQEAEQDLDQKGRELAAFVARYPQFAWDPTKTQGPLGVEIPKGTIAPSGVPPTSDPALASLYKERARLEAALSEVRGRAVEPVPAPAGSERPPALAGPLAAQREARMRASQEFAAAQADLAEKRLRYTDEHPDLIAARNRVVTSGRLLSEAERALALAREATAAGAAAPSGDGGELERKLAQTRIAIAGRERMVAPPSHGAADAGITSSKEGGFVALEAEWQRLMREAADARRHKEDITQKRAKAELAASATKSSGTMVMTVIDPAFCPQRPIKPNRRLAVGLSSGLGLLLGALWALAGVLLSDIVHDASDLESMGGPEVLATIPRETRGPPKSTTLVLRGARPRAPPVQSGRRRAESRASDVAHEADPRRRTIVTEPSSWGSPLPVAQLAEARVERASTDAGLATEAVVGASIEVYPIHALGPEVVVSPKKGVPSAVLTELPNSRSWQAPARNGWSGRVQRDPWSGVMEGNQVDGVLDGSTEPCEVVFEAAPDGVDTASFLSDHALSALRLLRHWVEQRSSQGGAVVGITSAAQGEGKTRLAAQLALALAESERARVLLVEANFERPGLAGFFGLTIPPYCGFSAQIKRRMLNGSKGGWGVVSVGPALHLLLEASGGARWPAALHSREFAMAVGELRGRYDYVVIDGPSVMDGGNATSVEMVADGLLMVARAGVSKASAVKRAGRTLGGRRLLGVVLLDAVERAQ